MTTKNTVLLISHSCFNNPEVTLGVFKNTFEYGDWIKANLPYLLPCGHIIWTLDNATRFLRIDEVCMDSLTKWRKNEHGRFECD
jgi:hypothetical protein